MMIKTVKKARLNKKKRKKTRIRIPPESFRVEEITKEGRVIRIGEEYRERDEPGDYVVFALQKKEWSTDKAVREIAKRVGASQRRFSYAGMKDRNALTVQLCSAYRVDKENLLRIRIRNMEILGCRQSKSPIKLGELGGNRFEIRAIPEQDKVDIEEIYESIGGVFPNYFGEQRFGSTRRNTARIGELIIKGKFFEAVMEYLCKEGENEPEHIKMKRRELRESRDFERALKEFPKSLSWERRMLEHLAKHQNDPINALRALPRYSLLMFVHAFQSEIFNRVLDKRITNGVEVKDCVWRGENKLGFPEKTSSGRKWPFGNIIGYETKPSELEREILEEIGVSEMDFKIRKLPEVSSRGTIRAILCPIKNFSYETGVFKFSLPPGAYATEALSEFIEI